MCARSLYVLNAVLKRLQGYEGYRHYIFPICGHCVGTNRGKNIWKPVPTKEKAPASQTRVLRSSKTQAGGTQPSTIPVSVPQLDKNSSQGGWSGEGSGSNSKSDFSQPSVCAGYRQVGGSHGGAGLQGNPEGGFKFFPNQM